MVAFVMSSSMPPEGTGGRPRVAPGKPQSADVIASMLIGYGNVDITPFV